MDDEDLKKWDGNLFIFPIETLSTPEPPLPSRRLLLTIRLHMSVSQSVGRRMFLARQSVSLCLVVPFKSQVFLAIYAPLLFVVGITNRRGRNTERNEGFLKQTTSSLRS